MSFILFTTGGAYLLLYEALVDTLVVSMYRFRKIFDSHVPFQLCIQGVKVGLYSNLMMMMGNSCPRGALGNMLTCWWG